jgi:uncharacterized repeat protein (TIGR03803 family)
MLYLTPKKSFCRASLLLAIVAAVLLPSSQAQTFSVIHTFNGADGSKPLAGVSIDAIGRLYGTTWSGGSYDDGTTFRLARQGSGWILNPLLEFYGNNGTNPLAKPGFAPNGLLYGTTNAGGHGNCEGLGCGEVYALRPGPTACTSALCPWSGVVALSFSGINAICELGQGIFRDRVPGLRNTTDTNPGVCPGFGDLAFDAAGNVYGTVSCCDGSVYELTSSGTNVLYSFSGGADGSGPLSGVIFDQAGNLYGTTYSGGANGCGTVYELSPNGSSWTETVLYSFGCDTDSGSAPIGGLIIDAAGNLYGTTNFGGANHGGTVFELSPSGGGWTFQLLYSLRYNGTFDFIYYGPTGSLAMDAAGNLYGTGLMDGSFGGGNVFKLTPSNGSWTYTDLYDFDADTNGTFPWGDVSLDVNGNLYGTTSAGGNSNGDGYGVVWEITP